MALPRVDIWTDGSSLGNPGPGGWAAILLCEDASGEEHRLELSEGYGLTTNNRMELLAPAKALEALKRPCSVTVHSDSQYVVKAHTDGWIAGWLARGWTGARKRPVANVDLWRRLLAAEAPHEVRYLWVRGHEGTELNERADELARAAAQGEGLLEDEGFRP